MGVRQTRVTHCEHKYMLRQTLLSPVFSLFHCLRQSYIIQTTLKRAEEDGLELPILLLLKCREHTWVQPDLFLLGAGAQVQSLSPDRQVPYQLYPQPNFLFLSNPAFPLYEEKNSMF